MRPFSSTFIAVLKPRPSLSPIRFAAGTRQFSKMTSQVCAPRCPILRSFLPSEMPGDPASTMNAVQVPKAFYDDTDGWHITYGDSDQDH